jgi:hypothetical protein
MRSQQEPICIGANLVKICMMDWFALRVNDIVEMTALVHGPNQGQKLLHILMDHTDF